MTQTPPIRPHLHHWGPISTWDLGEQTSKQWHGQKKIFEQIMAKTIQNLGKTLVYTSKISFNLK